MKYFNIKLFLIYILIKLCACENQQLAAQTSRLFCNDVQPQLYLDIEQILGYWFGSEIITHAEETENLYGGVHYMDTCVTIHLSDITHTITTTTEYQRNYNKFHRNYNENANVKYLSLFWQENQHDLEYTLKYNVTNPGYWISISNQRGSMLNLQYEQFSGTVQVVKAVRDHIVLTFCNQVYSKNFYTIILSREPNSLTREDLKTIHSLIRRKGLPEHSIRKVCTSNSNAMFASFKILLLSIILSIILKK